MYEKSATRKLPSPDPLALPIGWGVRRLLRWPVSGSLTVEFPNGRQTCFGNSRDEGQPLLKLNNYRGLAKVIRRGALGFAEAYMDQDIDCSDLTGTFRFFLINWEQFRKPGRYLFKVARGDRAAHRSRRNSRTGSQRNITEHYDLGNEFFRLWLDPDMIYSSALFSRNSQTLHDAQIAKLDRIIDLLSLDGGEEILEIGCGWGAFARRAAHRHGARVTGLTLSHEQLDHARALIAQHGLGEQCAFRLEDYRDVQGSFDHIVSIEMIEAVGEDYWPEYFHVLAERLKTGGSAVVQAITIDEPLFENYRNGADFIQRFIFPGGMLPTRTIMDEQAKAAGLTIDHSETFRHSYARTLREWRKRFEAAWPEIAKLGFDEHFRRRWRYYLAYCEAGFLEGTIDVGIYRLRKP
jgi:cyclopropane-fatty-acyl-phospholipid synthase